MRVDQYLRDKHVPFTMHEHPPAYTAQEVAAEEHVSGKLMAKTVVVRADDKYAVCVLPANCMLDMGKAAKMLHARDVHLADEIEMARLFPDAEVGAEPPFGNLYDLPTLVDSHLVGDQEIVFQAGTHRHSVHMKYYDYESVTHPEVADLAVSL